jgi:hypothetical protein
VQTAAGPLPEQFAAIKYPLTGSPVTDLIAQVFPPSALTATKGTPVPSCPAAMHMALDSLPMQLVPKKIPPLVRPGTGLIAQVFPPSVLTATMAGPVVSCPTAVQMALDPLPVQLVALKFALTGMPVTDFFTQVFPPSVLTAKIGVVTIPS